jgi:2-polyprenyl-3-methyl-5-hydroxy-6-metoxy-1,4-benzoquinol methylase
MIGLGEASLRRAVWLAHCWRNGAPHNQSETNSQQHEDYIRWQFDTSHKLFDLYPNFNVRDREVLEIGCGTGGRAAYLASSGAKRVVGIDINEEEIDIAAKHCPILFPETAGRLDFRPSLENDQLDIGQFDTVLLVDCMEHVVSPPSIMRLAHAYTKPGGKCYFSCIGILPPSWVAHGVNPLCELILLGRDNSECDAVVGQSPRVPSSPVR